MRSPATLTFALPYGVWPAARKALVVLVMTVAAAAGFGHPAAPAAWAAPAPTAFFDPNAVPPDVPAQVLIGETFTFRVRFKNATSNPTDVGFGGFIDLAVNARGASGPTPTPWCDGIRILSAQMIGVSGGPLPLPTSFVPQGYNPSACGSYPTSLVHPYANVPAVTVPAPGWQLATIEMPFGSFTMTQPDIVVEVTATTDHFANLNVPLEICTRGGFHFGATATGTTPILENTNVLATTWKCPTVLPTVLKLTKKSSAPEAPNDEAVSGPNFASYYPLTYSTTVNIADGQTIDTLTFEDLLPPNVQYLGPVQVLLFGTPAVPVTTCLGASPGAVTISTPTTAGGLVSVTVCGLVTGQATDSDVTITFPFYVPELAQGGKPVLDPNTCDPVDVVNDVRASGKWTPLDTRDGPAITVVSDVTPKDHTLKAKCLAIQKSVSIFPPDTGHTGATPNDVLRYELRFQVSDYFTFGRLAIQDILADGQTFLSGGPFTPTLKFSDQFASGSGAFPASALTVAASLKASCTAGSPLVQTVKGATVLGFDVSAAMQALASSPRPGILTGGWAATPGPSSTIPATGTLAFYARINDAFAFGKPGDQLVDKHDPMNNCVTFSGTRFTNVPAGQLPTATTVDADDGSASQISIASGLLKKSVVARNGSPTKLVGSPPQFSAPDTITFELQYQHVPSTDAEQFAFTDWLALPVLPVTSMPAGTLPLPLCSPPSQIPAKNAACYVITPPFTFSTPPTTTPNPQDNSVKFDFGTFHDPQNVPRTIVVRFTLEVGAQPFADGLRMTNETQECENNSLGIRFCQTAIAPFVLAEPALRTRKGVFRTSNSTLPPFPLPVGVTDNGFGQCPRFNGTIKSPLGSAFTSSVTGVDANDTVSFAIVVENYGTGFYGAFDTIIKDAFPTPPLNYVSGSLCIRYGDGTAIPIVSGSSVGPLPISGLQTSFVRELQDAVGMGALAPANDPAGKNLAIVTFDVKLDATTPPGIYPNTTSISQYAAAEGGPNFAPQYGSPLTATATVSVLPGLTKSIKTTSEAHTPESVSPRPVAIGEIIRYRLQIQLPEGVAQNVQIVDHLPPGLSYLGNPTIAFVSTTAGAITSSAPGVTPPFTPGNEFTVAGVNPVYALTPSAVGGGTFGCSGSGVDPIFSLGTVTNNDNDNNAEFIVLEFNALVCNVPGNVNGTTLSNTFSVTTATSTTGPSKPVAVIVVEPRLSMMKTAAPTSATPGTIVTYVVSFTNTGTADAFNVVLTDTLPAGLGLLGGVQASCPGAVIATGTVNVVCPQVPVGTTVLVTYQAVAQPASCPVTLVNRAFLTWTSLPGPQGTVTNPTGSSTPSGSGLPDGERNGVTPPVTTNKYATQAAAPVIIGCGCCVLPPSDMVSWWPLDETSGSTVHDVWGGHSGTTFDSTGAVKPIGVSGGPPSVTGQKVGNSLHLGPHYVQVPNTPSLNFGVSTFSVDAWVRLNTAGNITTKLLHPIVDKTGGTPLAGYTLFVLQQAGQNTGQLGFILDDGTGAVTPTMLHSAALSSGWHHVAVTVTRPGMSTTTALVTLYVDGGTPQSFLISVGNTDTTSPLWIGKNRPAVHTLLGASPREVDLDEVEIFKRPLTPAEVQAIYGAGPAGKCKTGTGCDLLIRKTVKPSPLINGQPASVTVTVTNMGTAPCPGPTTVTESAPSAMVLTGAAGTNWTCLGAVCMYPNPIPAGTTVSVTYTFMVKTPVALPIENCVTVANPNDTNPANDRACLTTPVK